MGLLASAGKDVTLLRPWSCGKNICPPGFTGQVCEIEIGLYFYNHSAIGPLTKFEGLMEPNKWSSNY